MIKKYQREENKFETIKQPYLNLFCSEISRFRVTPSTCLLGITKCGQPTFSTLPKTRYNVTGDMSPVTHFKIREINNETNSAKKP